MKNQKYDLTDRTEQASDILQKVIEDFALPTDKRSVISLYCHGLLSEKAVKWIFERLPSMKGM